MLSESDRFEILVAVVNLVVRVEKIHVLLVIKEHIYPAMQVVGAGKIIPWLDALHDMYKFMSDSHLNCLILSLRNKLPPCYVQVLLFGNLSLLWLSLDQL